MLISQSQLEQRIVTRIVLVCSSTDGDYLTFTRHEPMGVCGQIIPVSVPVCFLFRCLVSEDKSNSHSPSHLQSLPLNMQREVDRRKGVGMVVVVRSGTEAALLLKHIVQVPGSL